MRQAKPNWDLRRIPADYPYVRLLFAERMIIFGNWKERNSELVDALERHDPL